MLVATKRWMRATIDAERSSDTLVTHASYGAVWCAAGYSYSIRGFMSDVRALLLYDWDVNDEAAAISYVHAVTHEEDDELYNFIEDANDYASAE